MEDASQFESSHIMPQRDRPIEIFDCHVIIAEHLQIGADLVGGLSVALTYGHDAHNLTVFGGNDADMALAANGVIEMQGGICAASGGRLLTQVPLPLAGLLSPERPETLLAQLRAFLSDCARMGFHHKDLMSFFTIMPLAVSPEIKCTDRGLVDVAHKRFLPLIEERRGS